MNKKGFTLVELLAVIILLFLIITFALPQITNSVNNNRKKTDEITFEMIKSAAKLYISDNESEFPKINGSVYYLPLSELVDEDYLNEHIEYDGTNIKDTKRVTVVYNNGYEYYLTNLNTCTLVDGEPKEIGSKYECEVKEGVLYNFYVLSDNNDGTYNLIMDRNVYYNKTANISSLTDKNNLGKVDWISEEDYGCGVDGDDCSLNDKGPVTAMKYLYNSTKDWINLQNIEINYEDENIDWDTKNKGTSGYGTIITENNTTRIILKDKTNVATFQNLKARLPKYKEIIEDGCQQYDYELEVSVESCPLWLVNYLSSGYYKTNESKVSIDGINGYWLLASSGDYSKTAYVVRSIGDVYYYYVYSKHAGTTEINVGIRPVITVKL